MELGQSLLIGLGVALALEGIAYTLGPDAMKRVASMIGKTDSGQLRQSGIMAVAMGVILVWLSRL